MEKLLFPKIGIEATDDSKLSVLCESFEIEVLDSFWLCYIVDYLVHAILINLSNLIINIYRLDFNIHKDNFIT